MIIVREAAQQQVAKWIRCSRSKICSSAAQDAKVSAGTVTAVVVLQLTNR